jgi:glycerophosphoryl diester phosphodiesterase
LAVIHDTDTRRVAPGQPIYTVKRQSLANLQKLDVGSWKDVKFANERIPAIKDVLAALGPEQEIFIELKSRESIEIMKALDQSLSPPAKEGVPAARVVVMGFDESTVRAIKKKRKDWRVVLLLNHKPSTHLYGQIASSIRAKFLDGIGQNRTWTLTTAQYAEMRAAGAILSVWTVNNPAEAKVWEERGFNYLTSDCPEKFLKG